MTELGQVMGIQKWRLRALNPESLVVALDRYGMHHVVVANGVEVDVGSEDEVADLIRKLVVEDVQVVSSSPVTSMLEATYLNLTQGER